MKLKLVFLIIVASATAAQAQQSHTEAAVNEQPQAVVNDDRGRAFVIRRETDPLPTRGKHERVILEPQQYSIFLGNDWAEPSLRAREANLANLLASLRDEAMLNAISEAGVKNFFGPATGQEKLDDLSGNISDLEIQNVLSGMLKDGTLPKPNPNAIYVLYLDPELRSTLGSMIAGKHYVAYHSFFNAAGTKLHYVVVPFEADQKTAYQIALRAFVVAALNPRGSTSN